MSTATIQQIGQDLATWLGLVQSGETVAIQDQDGRIVARLTPPGDAEVDRPSIKSNRSMSEWLAEQDRRMALTFGSRTIADSSAALNDLREDRE